ncbi:hypothetical protein [Macrococcoides caseolyticum]|uniref:hypothetical protein n=1 Tax=Macrococcoides caseolyticum TaxID=69966 RepID=UPI000C34D91A|nr:hypothetical protein [Macrococcus caseolyticus]PKE11871.1 hypothetical protein CW685_05415 [Macrococcus caseolyticus]PKE49208.1 hypothetical protein CW677_00430 [Macrococcus caseolyticus]PKF16302.1 hypothetical protein CW690_00430 [Macrococcus caseolyticus]PNZ74156.1 hypothetical protein CD152_03020 [Macrococcus caseolyticus]QPT46566.1 hypothetical protein I6G25_10405 [Macrococcus caseolyticus]
MKRMMKMTLLTLGIIMLLKEIFLGIPGIGGAYILSLAWAPLGTNITLYFIMFLISALDRSNETRFSLSVIAFTGLLANAFAFFPILGMFMHWLMAFLMIAYIFIVINTREYRGNTTYYDPYRSGETVRDYNKEK